MGTLDLHANVTQRMVREATALIGYHTAPHVDTYETGFAAAQMLLRILREGVRTEIGFAKLPFLLPGEMAQTSLDPMASMMGMGVSLARSVPANIAGKS